MSDAMKKLNEGAEKLDAIEYLIEKSVYGDEWSGAGMWEAVEKVMARKAGPISEKYLDRLIKEASER